MISSGSGNTPTAAAADVLQTHKFEAQSGSESGITVRCTCKHQSTAPGFRAARQLHYEHVAAAVLAALADAGYMLMRPVTAEEEARNAW